MRADPIGRAEMRAASFSKPQWKAGMQAIEDQFDGAAVKAAIDAATGVTTTNALSKAMHEAWMNRKWRT